MKRPYALGLGVAGVATLAVVAVATVWLLRSDDPGLSRSRGPRTGCIFRS